MKKDNITCPICRRDTPADSQEKHHLVPKAKQGKITILLCRSCGDMLHQIFTNKELAKKYNTLETILADERVQKWAEWIKKKPDDFTICMARKKRR